MYEVSNIYNIINNYFYNLKFNGKILKKISSRFKDKEENGWWRLNVKEKSINF